MKAVKLFILLLIMSLQQAFITGFCKAAESHGVAAQFMPQLLSTLKHHEGFTPHTYSDPTAVTGKAIGYGFTDPKYINMGHMNQQLADNVLAHEAATRVNNLSNYFGGHVWNNIPQPGKVALSDLEYQAGMRRGWPGLTKAIQQGNYTNAVKEILHSAVNSQTPGRNFDRAIGLAQSAQQMNQVPSNVNITNWVNSLKR